MILHKHHVCRRDAALCRLLRDERVAAHANDRLESNYVLEQIFTRPETGENILKPTLLHVACSMGNAYAVSKLLEVPHIEPNPAMTWWNGNTWTALRCVVSCWRAREHEAEIVELLLDDDRWQVRVSYMRR